MIDWLASDFPGARRCQNEEAKGKLGSEPRIRSLYRLERCSWTNPLLALWDTQKKAGERVSLGWCS